MEKVAGLLRALSHNDFRGCFKGLKALQSIVEFLIEITANTITSNNNFTDKILFKNQSHYLSATLHT
jgi:L-ribulose-5-phosphate 3-epimerase UlaE